MLNAHGDIDFCFFLFTFFVFGHANVLDEAMRSNVDASRPC